MEYNANKKVYINPNFKGPLPSYLHNQENRTSVPHFNPLFGIRQFSQNYTANNGYENNQSAVSERPKIHVNPKMLQRFQEHFPEVGAIVKPISEVNVPTNGNRFIKINPPKQCNDVKPVEVTKSNEIAIQKIRKPSHKLIRVHPEPAKPTVPLLASKVVKVQPDKALYRRSVNNKITKSKVKLSCFAASTPKKFIYQLKSRTKTIKLPQNLQKGQLKSVTKAECVFIGGHKFMMKGNLLVRIKRNHKLCSNKRIIKQITVEGKIYVKKSENLFVHQEKRERKIMRKINKNCPTFRRLGVCRKFDEKKCPYLHDRKHVVICKKFLQGTCDIKDCYLSHSIIQEKMPTCKFYLEGCCARENCPYLHVKVSPDAEICDRFLDGYCAAGIDCDNIHMFVCPNYYKTENCNAAKCPYPHHSKKKKKAGVTKTTALPSSSKTEPKKRNDCATTSSPEVCDRYYVHPKISDDECGGAPDNEGSGKRSSIGSLPSFISI